MKRYINILRTGVSLLTLGAVFYLVAGCGKQYVDPSGVVSLTYKLAANADGSQVQPAAADTGTGRFTGFYDAAYKSFSYTVRWKNLWPNTPGLKDTILKANFYGPAGSGNGDSMRPINILPAKLFNLSDSMVNFMPDYQYLNAAEEADLLGGKWSFMICTAKYPNGIIRGQITAMKN